jgi:hypothetical protein
MNDDRDPELQNLFAKSREDLSGEAFIAEVMSRTDRLKRKTLYGWLVTCVVLIPVFWLLAGPVREAGQLLTQILPLSIVEVGDHWIAQVFSPVNSIAFIVAIGLIGMQRIFRMIFS